MNTEEYINNPHDKIIRKILLDKEEGSKFINKALNLKEEEKLTEKDINHYNSSFVNNKLHNKISDIVYKVEKEERTRQGKGTRDIYIIIEHQSKKDALMEYRMFDYKVEIVKIALDKSKIRETRYQEPAVIGIILYTGKENWREESDTDETKEKKTIEYWTQQGYTKYKLVEANKIPEEELLKEDTILSKILLLERAKDTKDIMKICRAITEQRISTKSIERIEQYIVVILSQVSKWNKKELDIVQKELKRREKDMMHLEEVLIKERDSWIAKGQRKGQVEGRKSGLAEGRKSGLAEGKRTGFAESRVKIIRKMIKNKVQDDLIKECTDVNEKELEQIKKEMQSQAV